MTERVRNRPEPEPERTVEEERLHRKRCLAAGFRLFAKFGFNEGVAGHITARDPGEPGLFWVNPFARHFGRIKVSDLVLVDAKGTVVEGNARVNRAAVTIHGAVHDARPEVVGCAHSHSVHGKAWAALGRPLLPITQDDCVFFEDHALYDEFGGAAFDFEEGKRIATALGPNKAAILRNHGLITVGLTVEECVAWFVKMERSCQVHLLAHGATAAGPPIPIDDETARMTREDIGRPASGRNGFRPLWEMIVAEQPDLLD
ncbi:class II aldolase/adducin family protein [Spongiactinospora sp. TRM90649]|uniref:class II aldolase/adducin family protein n=1 Tax=Spongiactinospora sp. TRM90649 TaxID=3031114 RepID=UPI0023F9BA25|nr:class II aldolase/adducin family protein [Spongiactinospora sp. TRM90649]MDF5756934.1 class II aldolase/adducin family protein [Spongiactinospora sp. TRM90649]